MGKGESNEHGVALSGLEPGGGLIGLWLGFLISDLCSIFVFS